MPRAVLALLTVLAAALAAAPGPAARAQSLTPLQPLAPGARLTYFIADGERGSAYRDGDRELALLALQDWERAAAGAFHFEEAGESAALVRVRWVPPGAGQYGEMRPLTVDGRPGAMVFVRPDTSALGPDVAPAAREDPLMRDTIVYLTCLHELGHALGLSHTADIRDIMYFFGYGGDIRGFFARYRNGIGSRADIASSSGLSAGDVMRLRQLYR